MNLKYKLLYYILKKNRFILDKDELWELSEEYNKIYLLMYETKEVNEEEYKNRWNFIYSIFSKTKTDDLKLFINLIKIKKQNLNLFLAPSILYSQKIIFDYIHDLADYSKKYNSFEDFIIDFLMHNKELLIYNIGEYHDIMNSLCVSNSEKEILSMYQKLFDSYIDHKYYNRESDYDNYDDLLDISYLYIFINELYIKDINKVKEFLNKLHDKMTYIIEKLDLVGVKSDIDMYFLVDKFYNMDFSKIKIIK